MSVFKKYLFVLSDWFLSIHTICELRYITKRGNMFTVPRSDSCVRERERRNEKERKKQVRSISISSKY